MRYIILALAATALAPIPAIAQHHNEGEQVMSEEAAVRQTVDAVYAAISGPAGAPRNWEDAHLWLTDDARLTPIGPDGHNSLDLKGYIARSEEFMLETGFFEIETGRRVEIFGNLAHVWSAYEGRTGNADGPIAVTGINSFQLVKTDKGWRVFSILWQAADDKLQVPADLVGTHR